MSIDLKKNVVRGLCVVLASALTIFGCSSKKNEGSYDMNTASVYADGCLNLGNLYANLQSIPEGGTVRSFTFDFSVSDKDQDGNSPSSARTRILNRSAYFFAESRPSELQNTWTSADQQSCSAGNLFDTYGNSTPFSVEDYKDNWIKVKLADNSVQRFTLVSERELRIVAEEFRGSQCITHAPVGVRIETYLRWGPSSDLPRNETVSARYMRELSQSVSDAPDALRTNLDNSSAEDISLSTSLLDQMNQMNVSASDLRDCPVTNKPPKMPELPTPTPSPSPSPTPEISPTPEPSPTPEI